VLGKSVIPDYMDEYIAIAVLLMSEKVKGAASRWKPYLDILPSVADVNPAYAWPDQELEMLVGSPTYPAAKSLRFISHNCRTYDLLTRVIKLTLLVSYTGKRLIQSMTN